MKKNKRTKHDPKKMILDKLSKSEGKGLSQKELMKAVRKKDFSKSQFYAALDDLIISGRVTKERDKYKASQKALKTGEVVKLNRTFGFVRLDENGQDVFIPGRFLLGAMPGDIVEIKLKKSRGRYSIYY